MPEESGRKIRASNSGTKCCYTRLDELLPIGQQMAKHDASDRQLDAPQTEVLPPQTMRTQVHDLQNAVQLRYTGKYVRPVVWRGRRANALLLPF